MAPATAEVREVPDTLMIFMMSPLPGEIHVTVM